jgi:hypothetical protein
MGVLFDSASSNAAYINAASTSGSVSAGHNVNPLATNRVAIACLVWTGGVDTTSATFGVTFGGTTMTALGSAARWNSNHEYMQWFILDGSATGGATVPTGSRTVTGSVTGIGTDTLTARSLLLACVTYQNVQAVGTPVVTSPSSSVNNTVTVTSVLPAHRVVTAHATGDNVFGLGAYNKNLRAASSLNHQILAFGATLLMGDADGAASVVVTATQPTTAAWGARGVSLSPVPVVGGAALSVSMVPASGGGTYRTATPAEDRYWMIPAIGEDDPNQIAGNFVQSSDGVHMPVWIKDPNDVEDYSLDWSNLLVEDDEIIAAKFTTTSSALTVFSTNFGDSTKTLRENAVTSCWFIGGVAAVNYGVTCHITTSEGRQHDRTFRIVGGQK